MSLCGESGPTLDDLLRQSDLRVEEANDVYARDWQATAKNYVDGKALLYVLLRHRLPCGKEHFFPFLIGKNVLELGWHESQKIDVAVPEAVTEQHEIVSEVRPQLDQIFPMLIRVGEFVNGPEGVVASRMWVLGHEEVPQRGSKFLFQSITRPGVWEWKWLPGICVQPAEGKPYARRSLSGIVDGVDDCFVECGAKPQDNFNDVERNVLGDVFVAACDYMRQTTIVMDAHRVGFSVKERPQSGHEIVELAVSAFDVFL